MDAFYRRMGFTLDETVALIGGGHSIANYRRVNNPTERNIPDGPFDPTPYVLDNAWFVEIYRNPRSARIPSDANMLKNPGMNAVIALYAQNPGPFYQDFCIGMRRLASLGSRYFDGYVEPEDFRNLREYSKLEKANGTSGASAPLTPMNPVSGWMSAMTALLGTVASAWTLSAMATF